MAKKKKARGRLSKGGNATTGTAAAMPSTPAGAEPEVNSGIDSATRLAVVVGLCVIVGLLAAGLTFNKLTDTSAALCGTAGGCDLIQHSHWSTLFGVPTAFWGLFTYVAIGAVAWMARTRERHGCAAVPDRPAPRAPLARAHATPSAGRAMRGAAADRRVDPSSALD